MKLIIADFADFLKGFKFFKDLVGTKIDYIELQYDDERQRLQMRTGTEELSACYMVNNVGLEDGQPRRFALSLTAVNDALDKKKGAGTLEVGKTKVTFTIGGFTAETVSEALRVQRTINERDENAPIQTKGRKKDGDTSWHYHFPATHQLGDAYHITQFKQVFDLISLNDQTKGVFSKGSYFGIRIEPQRLQMLGYDTLHIGHYTVACENQVEPDDDGNEFVDIVMPKALAAKLSKALGDSIDVQLGCGGTDWLLATSGPAAVATRLYEVRLTVAKILKQIGKETTDLFVMQEIEDVADFTRRAEGRSVATLSTKTGKVEFHIKGERTSIKEPMEADVVTPREELKMSAATLAECVHGLKGKYLFSANEKFLRIQQDRLQFLVIRGVAQ